jgi:hypothetical protein
MLLSERTPAVSTFRGHEWALKGDNAKTELKAPIRHITDSIAELLQVSRPPIQITDGRNQDPSRHHPLHRVSEYFRDRQRRASRRRGARRRRQPWS